MDGFLKIVGAHGLDPLLLTQVKFKFMVGSTMLFVLHLQLPTGIGLRYDNFFEFYF